MHAHVFGKAEDQAAGVQVKMHFQYQDSLVPRPCPAFRRTASDEKLGGAWEQGYIRMYKVV